MLLIADGDHVVWIPGMRMSSSLSDRRRDEEDPYDKDYGGTVNMSETIRVLIPEEEVDKRIRELGEQDQQRVCGKARSILICVLKGGVFFMCELAKRITVPVSMDFMCVGSYGDGTKSSGVVRIAKDLDESIEG